MQEANKVIVKYPTTKVDIEVDGEKLPLEVLMAEVQPVDVLLGCDVPLENLIIRAITDVIITGNTFFDPVRQEPNLPDSFKTKGLDVQGYNTSNMISECLKIYIKVYSMLILSFIKKSYHLNLKYYMKKLMLMEKILEVTIIWALHTL